MSSTLFLYCIDVMCYLVELFYLNGISHEIYIINTFLKLVKYFKNYNKI